MGHVVFSSCPLLIFPVNSFRRVRPAQRGTPILFAAKSEGGDSLVGYGVVDKVEYLWEMTPEEETYAKEHGWRVGLTLRAATRFKTPLLIKNSLLKDDKRKGAYLHGAKLSEETIDALLEQAEEIQEAA
jgi:hypothetical protein